MSKGVGVEVKWFFFWHNEASYGVNQRHVLSALNFTCVAFSPWVQRSLQHKRGTPHLSDIPNKPGFSKNPQVWIFRGKDNALRRKKQGGNGTFKTARWVRHGCPLNDQQRGAGVPQVVKAEGGPYKFSAVSSLDPKLILLNLSIDAMIRIEKPFRVHIQKLSF